MIVAAVAFTMCLLTAPTKPVHASGDIGQCMGDCASEQGMCISQCQGDGQCINRCGAAHGRCMARCNQ